MRKLNNRQVSSLKRVVKGGMDGAAILPETAKQLEKRGLVMQCYRYGRTEWNRLVAGTLMVCLATKAGEDLVASWEVSKK